MWLGYLAQPTLTRLNNSSTNRIASSFRCTLTSFFFSLAIFAFISSEPVISSFFIIFALRFSSRTCLRISFCVFRFSSFFLANFMKKTVLTRKNTYFSASSSRLFSSKACLSCSSFSFAFFTIRSLTISRLLMEASLQKN